MTEGLKKAAVFVLLKHNNKWLLLKRANKPHKGKYVPVGGKIDIFESPIKAAIRETYEETGLKVESLKYCGTLVETSPTNYNWISFIYFAEIDDMEPPYCDEGELEWINDEDLIKVDIPPTDLLIYTLVKENKKFALNAEFDGELNMISIKNELDSEM